MELIELLDQSAGIRQGDVMQLVSEAAFPYGARLGVVITADCDLAQGKHYGQALVCPIVPAHIYLQLIWCAKRLQNLREKALARARRQLDDLYERGVLASRVSDAAVEQIFGSESSVRTAFASFGLSDGKMDELVLLARTLALRGAGGGSPLARLAAASACLQGKKDVDVRRGLFAEFQIELSRDAVDIVAVHDDVTGVDLVHVVLLRAPFSLSIEEIALGKQTGGARAVRIGRFVPEVKYLIAQKFGTLFSRAGLKRDIELDRDAAIDLLEDKE